MKPGLEGGAEENAALLDLLEALREQRYSFVAVTPETHRRFLARTPGRRAADLRDVFGWNLPFHESLLPPPAREALERSGMMWRDAGLCKSRVRAASLGERLFLHSAFPTNEPDAVFFGPDSYRFAAFLRSEIPHLAPVRHLVDVGGGTGVGAIVAAPLVRNARLTVADINPVALRYARINGRHAGAAIAAVQSNGLAGVEGPMDLAVANPPFVADPAGRLYRHGGGLRGAALSLEWSFEAARRLEPGGTMLLYTGSAIVAGRDTLREALEEELSRLGCHLRYAEIDPDIFGELLDQPGYEGVERVAAVGAVIRKSGPSSL